MNEFLQRHFLILITAALVLLASDALADSKPHASSEKSSKPKTETKEVIARDGLYLGRIVLIDKKGRYIFVRPFEGQSSRRTFYLDKQTIYRKDGQSVTLAKFHIGSTVGVRFVSEGGISYAEGVFLIEGEINPQQLQMPKKKFVPSGPKAEKAEKPSGGHH